MCENLKVDRNRCDVCRTINLARNAKHPKPDMQMYDKCTPMQEPTCGKPLELPLSPTCIRVCTKEEYKNIKTPPVVTRPPHYAHGKLLYGVKAGILVGAVYFTYTQGVWGDQRDVTECIKRWQEYVKSINTRRPPTFDNCGNVIKKTTKDTIIGNLYHVYKSYITAGFEGVVKIPVLIKCAYVDYLKALDKQYQDQVMEARYKKQQALIKSA